MVFFVIWVAIAFSKLLIPLGECREQNETGCLEEYHNQSNPRRVRLVCTRREMIGVKRAFLATFDAPLQTAHRWCDNPNYNCSHCKQYQSELTDDFIQTCNTISVCTVNQYYIELPNCQSSIFNPQLVRRTYIHVEFDCLLRYDPNDSNKQIPFIHGNMETATGSILYIMSLDYPQIQVTPSSDQIRCIITLPQYTTGSIHLLDMGYMNSQNSTCPVRITVLEEYRCAQLGAQIYPGFDLKPSINQMDLPFYDVPLIIQTGTYVSHAKLWLKVSAFSVASGYYTSGMRVSCYYEASISTTILTPPPVGTTLQSDTDVNTTVQISTTRTDDGTLYAAIGGSVAGIVCIITAAVLVTIILKRRSNNKMESATEAAQNVNDPGDNETMEPYTYTRARFAHGHVNEGVVDTYEHLPDVERATITNAQETDYTQLPPRYQNHMVL